MQFLCVKLLSVKQIDQARYGRSDSLHTYSCAMQDNVPCRLSIYNGQQFELAVENPQYQDARVKKNSFSRCGEVNKQIGREQKKAIEQIPVEIKFSPTTVCKYSDFVILVHRNRIMREKSEKGFEEILNKLLTCVHLDKFFEPFLSRRHTTDDSENINSPKNSLSH